MSGRDRVRERDIVIVGGGFAGVWAALSGAELRGEAGVPGLAIALVSPREQLVIRPRLYEQNPQRMTVPLRRILVPVAVEHVRATATDIDTVSRTVTIASGGGPPARLVYRRLILASGSELAPPRLPGSEHLHDVDTLETAAALDGHLRRVATAGRDGRSAIVVGAGFTGIEVATTLVDRLRALSGNARDVRVVLVEREAVVGPDLGAGPRRAIEDSLAALGVECRLGTTLDGLTGDRVWLSSGDEIEARTVVWTAGLRASTLTTMLPATRDALGRLDVDAHLRVPGLAGVFAAGDTAAPYADATHRVLQSCQHAIPQGACAGANAVADLCGVPLRTFRPRPYVTCLDLGSAGAVYTTGWDRRVALTGAAAKSRKREINERWIYPPSTPHRPAGLRSVAGLSPDPPICAGGASG